MKQIKRMLFAACLIGFSGIASALGFTVDQNHSVVNYSALNQPEAVEQVSGNISANGEVAINIRLSTQDDATATLHTKVDMPELMKMPGLQRIKVPATLALYGNSRQIELDIVVTKIYTGELMVTSMSPVMINTQDFGATTADKVAVNFVVSFNRV